MRPNPVSQSKGDNEKSIFNYRISQARRVVGNAFGILNQKFQICRRTLQSLPENADIIFATCILHNYLRDQGVGGSDVGSSANVRSNLTKMPNQGGSAHQSDFEVTDKFKQFLLVCPDLFLGRMKECNVRLIYNIQVSLMLS
jgi:hypothetical protein